MLVILVIIDSHIDKTVLHLGKGIYIIGRDTLLDWLVAAEIRYPDLELGFVADMILK